jgi:DNA phosphorothioation-associated putative methyltransferase
MTTAPTFDWTRYKQLLQTLPYGKVLPTAVYLHRETEPCRAAPFGQILAFLAEREAVGDEFNVMKFRTDAPRISFLCYPRFFEEPHPSLEKSIAIDLSSGKSFRSGYGDNLNPPILHRKELLLAPDDPRAGEYATLSAAEEHAGLYDNAAIIGFRVNWERLLASRGLAFDGHSLVRATGSGAAQLFPSPTVAVHRHRTALTRYQLSKPVKTLLEFNQMPVGASFFDYGCGLGTDVRGLRELGFEASGWDPVHAPDPDRVEADVVNLGYVLNVIEDPGERLETMVSAWRLARRLLVVAALIGDSSADAPHAIALNDGILTRRNTFQKYFSQRELQSYIEDGLDTSAVPVAMGIFYIFRDSGEHQSFLESRSRRSIDWDSLGLGFTRPQLPPKAQRVARPPRVDRFVIHEALLEEFWSVLLRAGRMPLPSEFARHAELGDAFGSANRALRHLLSHGRQDIFRHAEAARKADLLVYLAIANLRKTIPFSRLPEAVRCDITTFFRSYKQGLAEGRDLLHAAADPNNIVMACEETTVGWQDERSLYVHTALVDALPTVVRTFIACAELLYGNLHEADILKIHKHSGKVTFLTYADFESSLLPRLTLRAKVNLRTQRVDAFDHSGDGQLLYFKERYIDPSDPQYPRLREISESLMKIGISSARFLGPRAHELCQTLSVQGRGDLIQALGLNVPEKREHDRDRT